MERTAAVSGDAQGREQVTCEKFGFTPTSGEVWWIPATKEKFLYQNSYGGDGWFEPYDGPVLHGSGYTF